jgi:hypothetical protein
MRCFSLPLLILPCNMLVRCFGSLIPGVSVLLFCSAFFLNLSKDSHRKHHKIAQFGVDAIVEFNKIPVLTSPLPLSIPARPFLPHPRIPQSRF